VLQSEIPVASEETRRIAPVPGQGQLQKVLSPWNHAVDTPSLTSCHRLHAGAPVSTLDLDMMVLLDRFMISSEGETDAH
jgi:hypothetical protein